MNLRGAPPLETLERWMQAVVMHPDGATAGVQSRPARRLIPIAAGDLESVVLPSHSLTSVERLDIYAHMYYARLLEILVAEYPTTRQILGPDRFAHAGRRFLALNPSRYRTLNRLSEKFADFLTKSLPRNHRNGLAVDVARIERAMEDVFDERRAEPLTAAAFAAIGADEWQRVRLTTVPALRFLKLRYPANDFMNAVRRGGKPRFPRPRPTFAIVYRRGYQVYRRDQEPAQFRLLAALAAGRTLAQAVRASASGRRGGADRLASTLGAWFREWAAAGLFCRIG
ncbi:MAG TPA: DNA-binding domain-containing protein [Steroidobacteraceae bacterium]